MAAHQAPPSLEFSRQEHWSGLPFPFPMHESEKWKWSRSVVSDSATPWTAAYQAPPSMGFSRHTNNHRWVWTIFDSWFITSEYGMCWFCDSGVNKRPVLQLCLRYSEHWELGRQHAQLAEASVTLGNALAPWLCANCGSWTFRGGKKSLTYMENW